MRDVGLCHGVSRCVEKMTQCRQGLCIQQGLNLELIVQNSEQSNHE
jgi:hypothetical protein